jgi:peptide-methionine (S)-S-oxide reductase
MPFALLTRCLSASALAFTSFAMSACNETAASSPKPAPTATVIPATAESLVLGGGCFWCVEAAYEILPGVLAVESGYAGGARPNPTYEQVCTGVSGHAEVVKITYEPSVVSRAELLDFFWEIHDPTTLNRQGADVGTQYRSVIYHANEAEKAAIHASRNKANPAWGGKIVTEISALPVFYPAEAYHQDYYQKNPEAGYCRAVIKPKLDKLTKHPLAQP